MILALSLLCVAVLMLIVVVKVKGDPDIADDNPEQVAP